MSNYNENINIAILGPVSAGKSTFFNSLYSNTCSDMKRKKTTMLPQIYKIFKDTKLVDSTDTIYNKNKESNEKILKLRENGQFNVDTDFVELVHHIAPIPDFISIPDKDTNYAILDMPGLNCGGDTLYYDYIKKISKTIDIYLLVFDINSGLNTTDEINILQLVVEQIQKNSNGYIHILINKCDDIQFDGEKIELGDEELNELYERCIETINKHCQKIMDKVSISPLCSSKLYIYRGVKNNISMIDENQLDNIIRNECGKQELKKLEDCSKKRKFISGLIKKNQTSLYDDWMNNTGYNMFIKCIDKIMQNYSDIIFYHINNDILKLNDIPKDNNYFDTIYSNVSEINLRIKKANKYSKDKKTPEYLTNNLNIVNNGLNNYLIQGQNTYSGSTIEIVNLFLQKIDEYYFLIKNLFVSNPMEKSKNALKDKRFNLLCEKLKNNFDYDIFFELLLENILHDELFIDSITNTFSKSPDDFKNIIKLLEKHPEKYSNITIYKYIEIGLNKKIEFNSFKENLEILLNFKSDDLNLISKIIITYLQNMLREQSLLPLYYDYWIKINSYDIKCSCNKIQFIFMKINLFISDCVGILCDGYGVNSNSDFIEFEKYTEISDIMKSILDLLSKNYNIKNNVAELLDFDNNESISENIISLKNNPDTKITEKSKIKKKLAVDSDCSDSETKYDEYSDSDNSEIVYKKAVSNSSKRTKKIIKKA
jgi:GTPase Era involved in 16S rRNA processing